MASDKLSSTLVFGGKRYRIDKWFPTKTQANEYADELRSKGALARVVTEHDGYSVFRRGAFKEAPVKSKRFERKGFKRFVRRSK